MSFIRDFFQTLFGTLQSLGQFNIALVWSVFFSSLCFFACNYYSRLWNKEFRATFLHKILSSTAAVLTFLFTLTFVAFASFKEIAIVNITEWSNSLVTNENWEKDISKQAYFKVKDAGLEDFTNYEIPNIPVTKDETRFLCADFFAQRACENLEERYPFLSKVLWADAGVPSDKVQEDIKRVFGGEPASNSTQINVISTDDEFARRLQRENAKSGAIQISLKWDNLNDLDLHGIDPNGEEIFWKHRVSASGGNLDVDKNRSGRNVLGRIEIDPYTMSEAPIENIFWTNALEGRYRVSVHHYVNNGAPDPTKFQVRVKVNDELKTFSEQISHGQRELLVYDFSYHRLPTRVGRTYRVKDAVRLTAEVIKENLEKQAPRVVVLARTILLILFICVQAIPFSLIGYAAYKNLKERTD